MKTYYVTIQGTEPCLFQGSKPVACSTGIATHLDIYKTTSRRYIASILSDFFGLKRFARIVKIELINPDEDHVWTPFLEINPTTKTHF